MRELKESGDKSGVANPGSAVFQKAGSGSALKAKIQEP
jgi:hypothetical protein